MKFLTKDWRYSKDLGILIFRLIFGLILLYGHGYGKLTVIFNGEEIKFMDPIGLGTNLSFYLVAFAEGICAILLAVGLFTRPVAAILVFNFLVVFFHHIGDGFAILELRLLYLLSYVALMITGSGVFSLDHWFFGRKEKNLI